MLTPLRALRTDRPPSPARAPPQRWQGRRGRHNLPAQLSSFVGRERELTEVGRLLGTTRLLTLTGTGGVGKTRLALQAAAGLVEAYPGGVWQVDLAALADPALVPHAVAMALGVREQPGLLLLDALADALRRKRMLLVLDNCEHLVQACAELADVLLHGCPDLQVLVASREVLGIAGETAWRVPSLSAPDRQLPAPAERLTEYEAVCLFVERARATLPSFAVTDRNAPVVGRLCERLDGIPLALELAAARVKALSVEQIVARLDDRFHLLTGGSRTAPPRHRTLRALVDWSYDLLSEGERALLRRLSVFAGGCTLEAAQAVCAGEGIERDDVLDLLAGLVDKSLVVTGEQGGEARYYLSETMRQYAADKLREAVEEAVARGRHRDWFLALAEEARAGLDGPEQVECLARLDAELDNLRAALAWSPAGADGTEVSATGAPVADAGLRLTGALWRFWSLRGHLSEGRTRLAQVLALEPVRTPARVWALVGVGYLAFLQADYAAMRAPLEEALALGRELGDTPGMAVSLMGLGALALHEGDRSRAGALFEQSVALSRQAGDRLGTALALYWVAVVAQSEGGHARATALLEEALALIREHGNSWALALVVFNLGHLALIQGDRERAMALLEESLAHRWQLKDAWGIAAGLDGLAWVAAARDRPARAARLLGAAEVLRESIGACSFTEWGADHELALTTARAALGADAFAAAWAEGRAMASDRAIEYALATEEPEPSAVRQPGPLTRREREVAALIAEGSTNRQIAAALVITEWTADSHVRHILNKLGFRSRAQVAAWAAEQGLHAPDDG